ncbi:MAG: hypothetical protein KVP17_003610, partial [Porospora cf. gigantea B]|uniref:uncharacterized protein n=1 Tax=Porospora cf. gigantea B TaxID=2853592 RepID=UPI003571CAC5
MLSWVQEHFEKGDVSLVRNVCVLAHVDHGKTTLCDHLLASNAIISDRSAGQIKYLDHREDEQERFITMKAATVHLRHTPSGPPRQPHLISVVDSPGHVDFSSEVSAAARLTDGAFLLVDAIEGICPQTRQVARQAWAERCRLALIINKVDRLFFELELDAEQAAQRINLLIRDVNVMLALLVLFDEENEAPAVSLADGSVILASATQGWAFDPRRFVDFALTRMKLPLSARDRILPCLEGAWTFNRESKRIEKLKSDSSRQTLFTQFVFAPLWHILAADGDRSKLDRLAASLGDVSFRGTKSSDLLRAWVPLSRTVLDAAVRCMPSPVDSAPLRVPALCPKIQPGSTLERGLLSCAVDAAPIVYVAKFVDADLARLTLVGDRRPDGGSDCLALARVFSGTVVTGTELHVCGSLRQEKDDAVVKTSVSGQREVVKVLAMYLVMGRDLTLVKKAPAGHIVALHLTQNANIGNTLSWISSLNISEGDLPHTDLSLSFFDRAITLSDEADTPAFVSPYRAAGASDILSVIVEPEDASHMQELLQGLGLLYRCDPSVTVSVTEHGEFQLGCCGEVHLEKCIGDLEHLYALVPIRVSPPYVSFRETIVDPSLVPDERTHLKNKITDSTVDHLERISDRIPFPPWGSSSRRARRDDLPTGTVCGVTSDKRSQVWLRAEMMRPEALAWLSEQTNSLNLAKASASALAEISATFLEHQTLDPQTFSVWFLTSDNKGMVNALVWRKRAGVPSDYSFVAPTAGSATDCLAPFVSMGFQKAMTHGPLANEIVRGVVIVIEDLLVPSETETQADEDSEFSCNTSMHKETRSTLNSSAPYGPQGGQLTSATLEACREAILRRGL